MGVNWRAAVDRKRARNPRQLTLAGDVENDIFRSGDSVAHRKLGYGTIVICFGGIKGTSIVKFESESKQVKNNTIHKVGK